MATERKAAIQLSRARAGVWMLVRVYKPLLLLLLPLFFFFFTTFSSHFHSHLKDPQLLHPFSPIHTLPLLSPNPLSHNTHTLFYTYSFPSLSYTHTHHTSHCLLPPSPCLTDDFLALLGSPLLCLTSRPPTPAPMMKVTAMIVTAILIIVSIPFLPAHLLITLYASLSLLALASVFCFFFFTHHTLPTPSHPPPPLHPHS